MASATMLAYPQPAGHAPAYDNHSSTRFPDFVVEPRTSHSGLSSRHGGSRYQSSRSGSSRFNSSDVTPNPGAILAANIVGNSYIQPDTSTGGRDSPHSFLSRRFTPPSSIASNDAKSPSSRTAAARDRFKSNLKKITQNKESDDTQPPAIDLSKTAAENEKQSGIGIQVKKRPGLDSSDSYPHSFSHHERSNTFSLEPSISSFKPSTPFTLPVHEGSRPHSPMATKTHSYSNSIASEYSIHTPRPVLRVNTLPDLPSTTRPRHNTNQSASSFSFSTATPTGPTHPLSTSISNDRDRERDRDRDREKEKEKSSNKDKARKSLDRTLIRLGGRRGSNATTKSTDEPTSTRLASIQAARQAFDEAEERKDAKYDRRMARDRERELRKARRRSGGGTGAATPVEAGRASPAVSYTPVFGTGGGTTSRRSTFSSVRGDRTAGLREMGGPGESSYASSLRGTAYADLPFPEYPEYSEYGEDNADAITVTSTIPRESSSSFRKRPTLPLVDSGRYGGAERRDGAERSYGGANANANANTTTHTSPAAAVTITSTRRTNSKSKRANKHKNKKLAAIRDRNSGVYGDVTKTRAVKNQYAWAMSWWKTKMLNLKRRRVESESGGGMV